jgi:hypothetical protein
MSADERRRKSSRAVRFYGRSTLPPLKDKNGKPARFAPNARNAARERQCYRATATASVDDSGPLASVHNTLCVTPVDMVIVPTIWRF